MIKITNGKIRTGDWVWVKDEVWEVLNVKRPLLEVRYVDLKHEKVKTVRLNEVVKIAQWEDDDDDE